MKCAPRFNLGRSQDWPDAQPHGARDMNELVEKLEKSRTLDRAELALLLGGAGKECDAALFAAASRVRRQYFGSGLFIRGLIEFTNYCKNKALHQDVWKKNSVNN